MTETKTYVATMQSPIGRLVIEGEGADRAAVRLSSLSFAEAAGSSRSVGASPESPETAEIPPGTLADVLRQLDEYFAGARTRFDLDHVARGTPFQQRVWEAVDAIEPGTTATYGQIAEQVGAPRDRIRAVAAAIGANPLLIVRPCHRVVAADGSLTGYAGGIDRKRFLLAHEGVLQPALFG